MWTSTEHGTPATSAELLERLEAESSYTTRMLSRYGEVRNLDAHVDELVVVSRQMFERPVDPRVLLSAIHAALSDNRGTLCLRVELYGREEPHVLVLATDRCSEVGSGTVNLRTRPPGPASHPQMTRLEDAYELTTANGLISGTAAGSLCFVSAHRFIWPDSQSPLATSDNAIADRLQGIGMTSVRLPVRTEHLTSFDGAFLIQTAGVHCVASIDTVRYALRSDDLITLEAAFEFGPWRSPTSADFP
jgi:hypothetical protein